MRLFQHRRRVAFAAAFFWLLSIVLLQVASGCGEDAGQSDSASDANDSDRGRVAADTDSTEQDADPDQSTSNDRGVPDPDDTYTVADTVPDTPEGEDTTDEDEEPVILPCYEESGASECGEMDSAWPQAGGNGQHTGRTDAVFYEDYVLEWDADVPNFNYGGTAVSVDGLVIGASNDSTLGLQVYAGSVAEEGLAWTLDVPEGIYGIDVTPALSTGNRAYFLSQSGHLIAVDLQAREFLHTPAVWTADGLWTGSFFRNSPLIDSRGALYTLTSSALAGGDGALVKINPEGGIEWFMSGGDYSSGDGSPALNHDGQIVAALAGALVVVNPTTGGIVNSVDRAQAVVDTREIISLFQYGDTRYTAAETRAIDLFGTPAIDDDGTIYIAAMQGIMSINPDLSLNWINMEVVSRASIAVGQNMLYVIDYDADLQALDKETGEVQWSYTIGEGFDRNRAQPIVDACDNVAVASTGHNFAVLKSNSDPVFETTFEGQALTGPSTDDTGRIFIRGYRLYSYSGTTRMSCD